MVTGATFIPAVRGHARRVALGAWLLVSACLSFASDPDWIIFRQRFITAEGRVVDTAQGDASHSEGQGFAMLLATHHGDRASFDMLWKWTRQNLQVRDDSLLAWRWQPKAGVTDRNNASDADLLVAWSLLRAGKKWNHPAYTADGLRIAQDIRTKLLRRAPHGLVLLPGLDGFERDGGLTVNLSYWVLPALREIARAEPAPEWQELESTGVALLQYARFGHWGLPPDWLKLGEKVAPADGFPQRFGYDAVRIPLYLLWSGRESPALLQPYRDFWSYFDGAKFLPAWANLQDDSVDSHGALPGMRAIAQWVGAYPNPPSRLPALDAQQAYYSAALLLLCKMAFSDRGNP